MRKVKGCVNEECLSNRKKRYYKESEIFCSICGARLSYVCKDCYTQLPADTEKYCVRCYAKHEDRKANAKKAAAGVGTGVLAVGGVLFNYGGKAFGVVKKFKG